MGEAVRAPFEGVDRAAAGRRGAATNNERRRREKADPALKVTRALPGLFDDLIKAARGEGVWKELPLDKRLAALFKALEYGVGRPITRDKQTSPADKGEGDGVEQAGGLTVV